VEGVSLSVSLPQLLVALVESFIVIGAGILFVGFAGSRWTKFFTERYLSYVASVGVKLFVLYLIMGVGMSIAARWVPVLERGGFSPITFFYVMGGSLVFLFLTWHIPSVASAMMAGTVHLSIADVYYPAMLAGRAGAAGLATAGAVVSLGRWGTSRLREWTALHTSGGGGSVGGAGGPDGSPFGLGGDGLGRPLVGPTAAAPLVRATERSRADTASHSSRDEVLFLADRPRAWAGNPTENPRSLPMSRFSRRAKPSGQRLRRHQHRASRPQTSTRRSRDDDSWGGQSAKGRTPEPPVYG
jgi:type IV secretory pathway TrbL component